MAKIFAMLVSLLTVGVAYAQEEAAQQPVVLPEPNYWGIGIFFLIVIVSCGWYAVKVLKNKDENQK